jgi:predicted RNA-binding Zn-ribbon protein involved in translation (DUF1610 family)
LSKPKVLILDIETSPHLAFVWKFFKENISAKQVKENGYLLSFAAKWLEEDEIFYEENRKDNDRVLIKNLCILLDEADIVVAHNGAKFDLPKILGQALVHQLPPPSPVKIIDTCLIARKEFGFPSNSLEYLCNILNLKNKKTAHSKFPGFTLWSECLKGNEEAWAEMKSYNIIDILALEELYLRLRPYTTNHPNLAVYAENVEEVLCPKCGSTHIQWRGYAYTSTGKYHRYQCSDCGGWGRSRYTILLKNDKLIGNAVN